MREDRRLDNKENFTAVFISAEDFEKAEEGFVQLGNSGNQGSPFVITRAELEALTKQSNNEDKED